MGHIFIFAGRKLKFVALQKVPLETQQTEIKDYKN
jgi:hypothetical protein